MARAVRWYLACLTTSVLPIWGGAQPLDRSQSVRECVADSLAARLESDLGRELHRRTPSQTWRRMQATAVALDFRGLGDTVRALWDSLSPGIDAIQKGRMDVLLDTLARELTLLETDRTFRSAHGTTSRWFQLTEGDPGEPWLINGSAGANAITIGAQSTTQTVRAVCWTSQLALRVAEFGSREARTNSIRVLGERGKRWDNFDRLGYSLTPLELLINGWCGFCRGDLEPPRTQLVALHVIPSYVLRDRLGSRAALTTELFGLIFYNEARSLHWGLSYAVALPQEEKREEGWVLHVSNLGQVGLSFRDGKYQRSNASLVLSADLYRFIDSWQGKLRDQRETVRKGIERIRSGASSPQ